MSARSVVFWDIDGTLVKGSLERLFLKYLFEEEHLTRMGVAAHVLSLALRFPLPKWYQIKLAYLRNREVSEVETWIQLCWEDSIKNNMFDGARQVITHIADTGARQILLSGTLKPLATPLMSFLGIDEIIAADPEIVNNRYTGRLNEAHPHGDYKALYAERWLADNNASWDNVSAFANHFNDRHLLKKTARPIAVHPDRELRQIARQHEWPIVNDLKDILPHIER